ncbi:TetR/AcrR family transcriptional regulator [Streptomyces sp. NPDC058268]|uniref:TetR/AcrR family transcriptional regulator n=1 Tax=Streptomyces sp. NPDC058268 TaxID=3346413 RepID=UPI0036EB0575
MTTNDRPQTARSGGPRRKQQIFDATLKALARDGFESMTIEGIAEESGVNKTTIYRWWPSKSALLGAALIDAPLMDLPMADTGHLRGDLEHLVDGLVRLLTTHPSGTVARSVLGAAVSDPGLATYIQGFFADRLAREQSLIDRAVARGELPPGTDTMLLMDLLAGAVWLRAVFRRQPLDDDFARRTVATVLDGVRTS